METFPLDDLPDEILSLVFSKTSPQDAIQLRTVNKRFCKIASAQAIWMHLLPPRIMEIVLSRSEGSFELEALFDHIAGLVAIVRAVSKKDFLEVLFDRDFLFNLTEEEMFFDKGMTKGCWLESDTSRACLAISAHHRCFSIEGGPVPPHSVYDTTEDPEWMEVLNSRFIRCAFFWLGFEPHVQGTLKVKLPRGKYSFSWVWRFQQDIVDPRDYDPPSDSDDEKPLICIESIFTDGELQYNWRLFNEDGSDWELVCLTNPHTLNLSQLQKTIMASAIECAMQPENLMVQSAEFMEHQIGQFWVDQEDATDIRNFETTTLQFEMIDRVGTIGHEGLFFDGVVIRSLAD